jgi:hypothetical protein
VSRCEAWARFSEGDVYFDVECDVDDPGHDWPHHDPDLGNWDPVTGLHDRSLTPSENRLKR